MASPERTHDAASPRARPWALLLFSLNALVAWFGTLLSLTLNLTGYYVDNVNPAKVTLLGNTAAGVDTPYERFFDWITYFTIWSNIIVAVVLTLLVFRPHLFTSAGQKGLLWRALRLDSVLMIAITGVVYNTMLAGGEKVGWDFTSNLFLHVLTPIVTVVVWLLAGPRGLIDVKAIGASMILPIVWAVFALVRGMIVGAYPYPFLDVSKNGLASVIVFILVIIVVAVILAFAMMGIDALIRRLSSRRTT